MSSKSQQNNMKAIYSLLQKELGYCYGSNESGPNGLKKDFLTKSATFLRALAKDLGFTEYKVNTNPGGIAVSGEVSLYAMWGDGNGVYVQLSKPSYNSQGFLYREINHIKDYSGGRNMWLSHGLFMNSDYNGVLDLLSSVKTIRNNTEVRSYVA